ncbi:MAG: CoB--CoM heterodisulfide reductase iron-sulfur subunit A family protein [Candidatus Desulfofervidus auxilii]|nr:CoB--CoM heterodisulfide reductase iron-sulfur subunit A family protein [Candidatus Desulfofervidus auxilii]
MSFNKKIIGTVMVIGGGVAGVQAALDAAEMGYFVYLIEEKASIGGVMAQLDKTFPTNDCSLCILSPKLVEAGRHPNIKIVTQAKIEDIKGEAGNFQVKILKKPRYIDETKCTGCGVCSDYCPTLVFDIYNAKLSLTKCIHIDYPQAVPITYVIDTDACLFLNRQECQICVPTCKAEAIDFNQKEVYEEIEVGSVILAPGFSPVDTYVPNEYGYAQYPNVITSIEFERIMCASGPYNGEILRPSDKKHPKKIAFIQCIGSRTKKRPYCSAVCCMYAIKEAVVSKEHEPDLDIAIFYMDIRAQGKGFEEFYKQAKEKYNIRFIPARVAKIKEIDNHNLLLRYSLNGKIFEEEFDLVVLSVGLKPPNETKVLSKTLKIGLNKYGFCLTSEFNPINTTKKGIFVAGAFQGPKDIPESVTQASAAAVCASTLLAPVRNTLIVKKEYPPEIEIGEEPRIGIFVCHCGINIGGVVNVPEVKKYAATLKNVVFSDENLYSCSQDTQERIKEMIKKYDLNRIVVAACTPRTHEPLFQETIREAGLNRCLFEFVNIREQCSWVHIQEKEKATEKAKDLIRMGVAKARYLTPLKEETIEVIPKALIIGGGLAGMTAALAMADQGFDCFLIEKEKELGGNLKNLYYTLEGNNPQRLLKELVEKVNNHKHIQVFSKAEIKEISGYVGNFKTVIALENGETKELEHGVVIVATGGKQYVPKEYLYGQDKRIMTQLDLEKGLATGEISENDLDTVVMIQCVGSRNEKRPYCSKICCSQAIKNALKIKEIKPDANIYIFYRDIRTYGFKEDYYAKARAKGVIFIRYNEKQPPTLEKKDGKLILTAFEPILGEKILIEPSLVILSVGVLPHDNKELSKLLKVPLTTDGFFLEAHVKLRPVEAAVDGIFYAGIAHFPKPIDETISQALAAAAKATIILAKGYVKVEPIVSFVDKNKCIGCGICESLCPYKAIRIIKVNKRPKAETISASCKGCGICSAHCPQRAISMGRFTDAQIIAQIKAFGEKE